MRLNLKLSIKDEKKKILATALLFAGGAAFSTFCIQYLILEPENFGRISNEKLFLNVLCVLVWYLLIQIFTNHVAQSCAIAHIALMVLAFIDYFVYLFRGNEFTFADIRSIGTGLSVAENYKLELNNRGIIVLVLSGLFLLLVSRFVIRYAHPWQMRLIVALTGVLCVIIVAGNAYNVATETWEQKGTYRNGYILNFVLGIRDSFVAAPDGYSAEAVAELEETYSGADTASGDVAVETPTIIVIMNESFSDLSVLGDLETNLPLTPFMDSLKENTIRGYALSSVFGAKTPNSEWEFLTGNSMAFLPSGSVVYQQYISDTPTSIVSNLKDIGYTCVAMHPYYETGWSRNQVYPNLGYDEMYFIDDFDQTNVIRKYITDQELYDKIATRAARPMRSCT
jgi:phosphoglycerol transferase MdoB-like AlkP superfamily enzyme